MLIAGGRILVGQRGTGPGLMAGTQAPAYNSAVIAPVIMRSALPSETTAKTVLVPGARSTARRLGYSDIPAAFSISSNVTRRSSGGRWIEMMRSMSRFNLFTFSTIFTVYGPTGFGVGLLAGTFAL